MLISPERTVLTPSFPTIMWSIKVIPSNPNMCRLRSHLKDKTAAFIMEVWIMQVKDKIMISLKLKLMLMLKL